MGVEGPLKPSQTGQVHRLKSFVRSFTLEIPSPWPLACEEGTCLQTVCIAGRLHQVLEAHEKVTSRRFYPMLKRMASRFVIVCIPEHPAPGTVQTIQANKAALTIAAHFVQEDPHCQHKRVQALSSNRPLLFKRQFPWVCSLSCLSSLLISCRSKWTALCDGLAVG